MTDAMSSKSVEIQNGRAQEGAWDYAPAPESTPVVIEDRYDLFINGQFQSPRSRRWFKTISPSTGEPLARIATANEADVDDAVSAARDALPGWSRLSGQERAKYLFRIARRIQERARELSVLETMDGGKPIKESRDIDIPLAARHFFYHAGWADKLRWAFAGAEARPVGVCGQIIPWNFPLLMAAWKIAPALACGNTCVLKPAETTSLTALRLAEIFQEAGLPPGVVNIVTGAGKTGQHLAANQGIDKLAFTGSTEVGRAIAKVASVGDRNLTLELGGKSPHIIFADAALDQAIEGVVAGIWFNQGHVCCAGSRLFVEESIKDEVIRRLEHRMQSLRVGDPLDKNTDIGAINNPDQLKKIQAYVDTGQSEGGRLHEMSDHSLPKKGYWHRPCFLTGIQPSHVVAREEIFGPVLAVMTFRTPEEAIKRANNTPYGLAAGVWTNKGARIFEMAKRLEAGVIWCNTYNQFDAASPFGGIKESGFGREGGRHGLRAYVRL